MAVEAAAPDDLEVAPTESGEQGGLGTAAAALDPEAAPAESGAPEDRDEVCLTAVKQCGEALRFASPRLQDSIELCMVAVRQSGAALQYCSPRLRATRAVVLEAVKQNGLALQYASEELRAEHDVALAAVKRNRQALWHCPPEMRDDLSLSTAAVQKWRAPPQNRRETSKARRRKQQSSSDRRVLWRRPAGWHEATEAAAAEDGRAPEIGDEIRRALAHSNEVAARRQAPQPACASCGARRRRGCWACGGGWEVVSLVLQLPVVSSGGLDAKARASLAATCQLWRRALFASRIPPRMETRHAGRKWLQGWYTSLERVIERIPAAVAGAAGLAELDMDAGQDLSRALNQVVKNGVMPDFSHPGALVHYTVENLVQRAQKATAALLLDEARELLGALLLAPHRPTLRVAAVGGGPGFEAVGLAALAEHLRSAAAVDCLSLDIEPEWGPVLGSVVEGTYDLAGVKCCSHVPPETLAVPGAEGAIVSLARDGRWRRWSSSGGVVRCRTELQAAQLRLLLGFLHSDRLAEHCPLALEAGRVTETIAACFQVRNSPTSFCSAGGGPSV